MTITAVVSKIGSFLFSFVTDAFYGFCLDPCRIKIDRQAIYGFGVRLGWIFLAVIGEPVECGFVIRIRFFATGDVVRVGR